MTNYERLAKALADRSNKIEAHRQQCAEVFGMFCQRLRDDLQGPDDALRCFAVSSPQKLVFVQYAQSMTEYQDGAPKLGLSLNVVDADRNWRTAKWSLILSIVNNMFIVENFEHFEIELKPNYRTALPGISAKLIECILNDYKAWEPRPDKPSRMGFHIEDRKESIGDDDGTDMASAVQIQSSRNDERTDDVAKASI
jgi:hypothetical protein